MQEAISISRRGHGDGFGVQYYAAMTGLAYARHKNQAYRHLSFSYMDWPWLTSAELMARENRFLTPGQIWAVKMNKFTGLRSDKLPKNLIKYNNSPIIKEVQQSSRPEKYFTQSVREELRTLYFHAAKPLDCKYDVAINIRRNDITREAYPHRYVPLDQYRDLIKKFKSKNPDYTFCIYSDGTEEQLEGLRGGNTFFSLGEDPREQFHEMVTAPNLVLCRSYFCYTAAILSRGNIYRGMKTIHETEGGTTEKVDPYSNEMKPFRNWR
jgi:hypothetical protein